MSILALDSTIVDSKIKFGWIALDVWGSFLMAVLFLDLMVMGSKLMEISLCEMDFDAKAKSASWVQK